MSLIKYIRRLEYMDFLISHGATGSPEEFAMKLGIRRSTLHSNLKDLRSLGVDIRFSNCRKTYFYANGSGVKSLLKEIPQ